MSYCFCKGRVSNPKPRTCADCLVANDVIIGCGQQLYPCGDTTTIDLNAHNHNPATAVYSLYGAGYSTDDFSAVTISAAGIVSLTTEGLNYIPHGLYDINYQVVSADGKYKNFGTLQVCFDSPCEDGCSGKCNTCSGECYGTPVVGSQTAVCGEADKTYNAATGLNTGSCDGTTTWTVSAPSAISPSISNVGLITYDITGDAVPGTEYRITAKGVCSDYGMEVTVYLDVLVQDLCIGVTCDNANQECVKCTGICEDKESDMSGSGSVITSSSFTVSSS